jgi:ketosteroid isomerase-like protein
MIRIASRNLPRTALALAALVLSSTTLLAAAPAAAAEMSAPAKALAAIDEQWSKSTQSRDGAKIAAFYSQDAYVNPPGAKRVVGRAAAQQVWAAMFVDPSFKISWQVTTADVSKSGELGYVTGAYEYSFKGKDGSLVKATGKYLEVWQKQADGSWKCSHDMWNADAP